MAKTSIKLHRSMVALLISKFKYEGNLYKVKFVKGYEIENDLPFPIYAQKLSEKRHSKWTVNIGGQLTFYYGTLRELKENFFDDWNKYVNGGIGDKLDRAIQAHTLLETILENVENPCEFFDAPTMTKMRKIATQKYLLEKR